jgi:hypothetical protein
MIEVADALDPASLGEMLDKARVLGVGGWGWGV